MKFAALILMAAPFLAMAQTPKDSLADLIEKGDRKAALARVRAGADVNEAQPDGTRPIHWAVVRVDYELLDALLSKKARVNVTNDFGSTPLAEAAKLADARMVKALLDAGADVNAPNQDGQTALMLAIRTGELPVVEMLVNKGANVNTVESFHKQTPLMWAAAASKNAGSMVKLLLARGADVKPRALISDWDSQITSEPRAQYKPEGGLTALLYAARNGCYECADALVGAGADVNLPSPEGVTPLLMALDNDHNDVAKLLLEKGANPNIWDWWGRTALYITVDRRAADAAPAGRGGRGGGLAARPGRSSVSSMEIVNELIAAGVDLDVPLNMHRPSRGGNSGRFIEEFQNTGCTPLMRAAIANDTEMAKLLLDHGANPNITAMGLTPFLIAAGVGTGGRGTGLAGSTTAGGPGNPALMDVLLGHGANINVKVEGTQTYSMRISRAQNVFEGMTALQVAVQTARPDTVKYLLAKGADKDITDANGRKAIDLVGTTPGPGRDGQPVAALAAAAQGGAAAAAPGRGGARGPSPETLAELRALLQGTPAGR